MTVILFTIIAVLLRILTNPVANVFQKQLTAKGHHPLLVNFITYLALSIVCIFIAFFVQWPPLSSEFWIYSILGGITGALGNGFLVKALQTGALSVLGPVNSYKSIVGILTAIILLGEIPNVWGLLGIVFIIFGSYFVLDTTEERFSWGLLKRKDIQFRLWAMVLTAIQAVFDKKIILESSTTIAFIGWSWFGMIFSFMFLFIYRININKERKHIRVADLSKYLYLIICVGTMTFTTIIALKNMPVGYALALFQLSIIISVFLGQRYFKETNIRKKLIGSFIMIGGSVLIILLKDR